MKLTRFICLDGVIWLDFGLSMLCEQSHGSLETRIQSLVHFVKLGNPDLFNKL